MTDLEFAQEVRQFLLSEFADSYPDQENNPPSSEELMKLLRELIG